MGYLGSSQSIYDHQGLGAWIVTLVSGVRTSSSTIPKAWDLFLLLHSGKGVGWGDSLGPGIRARTQAGVSRPHHDAGETPKNVSVVGSPGVGE